MPGKFSRHLYIKEVDDFQKKYSLYSFRLQIFPTIAGVSFYR